MATEHTIVVTVLGGRYFPKRSQHSVVIDARFDEETLSTDPVAHTPSFEVENELAWLVDHKQLLHHRTQRTPIKLQCYAVHNTTQVREAVGYVMLELRTAQQTQTRAKWYPLQSTKYPKNKPELRVMLSIEQSAETISNASSRLADDLMHAEMEMDHSPFGSDAGSPLASRHSPLASGHQLHPHAGESLPARVEPRIPQLIDGWYHIGDGDTKYLLSITMIALTDCVKLAPAVQEPARLFLAYSLFGTDIHTDFFMNLAQLDQDFRPERATIKIKSSPTELAVFLLRYPPIQFLLCNGSRIIASTESSLDVVAVTELQDVKTADIELPLIPHHEVDATPTLKLQISLSHDQHGAVALGPEPADHHQHIRDAESMSGARSSSKGAHMAVDDDSDDEADTHAVHFAHAPIPNPLLDEAHPHDLQRYSCSVDLRAVRNLTVGPTTSRVYVRYNYPFFGSAAPIITHPPIEINRHSERQLPHSFCAFDFTAASNQLRTQLRSEPLHIEVYRSDQYQKDPMIGLVTIPLDRCLECDPVRTAEGRVVGIIDQYFPIVEDTPSRTKVGELRVLCTLENRGPVDSQDDATTGDASAYHHHHHQRGDFAEHDDDGQPYDDVPTGAAAAAPPNALSQKQQDEIAYRVAVELELWKRAEEEKFQQQLQEKEDLLMKTLASEWKARDQQRELLIHRRMEEYDKLEAQLKKALSDVETKEKRLQRFEEDLQRSKRDLEAEYESKLNEVRDASRRLQQDLLHQTELEQAKVRELNERIRALQDDKSLAENRYRKLEDEFINFRKQQAFSPSAQLEAQVNQLTRQILELERKLQVAVDAKQKYKAHWSRALQEVAKLKQREQGVVKDRLRREQQELQQLRMQCLARDERAQMGQDRLSLMELKQEISRLRESAERESHRASSRPEPARRASISSDEPSLPVVNERLRRLLDEREALLNCGVYEPDDVIIRNLDREIASINPAHVLAAN
eukprot:m.91663 g.91663  ORF g.91663 m.91663 type:complete len:973 (-) comp8611_c0_seq1:731-3649(-)